MGCKLVKLSYFKPLTENNYSIEELNELRIKIMEKNKNFYQELEMDSPFVDTHRDICYSIEKIQLHSHPFYEILLCESGNLQYLIEDKRYRLQKGDIVLIPPGISHRPIFDEKLIEPYERIVLWISSELVHIFKQKCTDEINGTNALSIPSLFRTANNKNDQLCEFIRRGCLERERCLPNWEAFLFGNTIALLSLLIRGAMDCSYSLPSEHPEILDKIISYIEANYSSKITLEKTAQEFHISQSTLGKLFNQKLNISFYHFVTQIRLINAKSLIENGEILESISLLVGFTDYSTFYRAFKHEYGISPRDYRNLINRTISIQRLNAHNKS